MTSWEKQLLKKQGLNALVPTGNSLKILSFLLQLEYNKNFPSHITCESKNLRDYSKEDIKTIWGILKGLTREQIAIGCNINITSVNGAKEQLGNMFYSILYK